MIIENNILIEVEDSDIINGTVNIPEEVIAIGYFAFYKCKNLNNIILSNNINPIEIGAFKIRKNLMNIEMSNNVKSIGNFAFCDCKNLTNIIFPNNIKFIGRCAFDGCNKLKSPVANYKAFEINKNNELQCRNSIFKENDWSENIENIELCERGYHYCTNLFEIFNYYYGELDKNIAIYECEAGEQVKNSDTSKFVTNKIKPVKRLSREEIIDRLNNKIK